MSCDRTEKPDFTKEQIVDCQSCKHASGNKIWCCLFGVSIKEPRRIIVPKRPKIIQPPTLMQMAEHFASAMIRWAKSGLKTVDKTEYVRRRTICSECSGGWRCPHCGCGLFAKVALSTETCPEERWGEKKKVDTVRSGIFMNRERQPLNIEGMYEGQSVFFVLNGPSLNDVNTELLHKPGIVTFGVNNGGMNFRPNLISLQDGPHKFHSSIWQDGSMMKFTNQQHLKKQYWAGGGHSGRVKDCPNVVYFKRSSDWTADEWFNRKSVCWGAKKRSRNSFIGMIHIAFLLGFKNIYLVGGDFKMNRKKPYWFNEGKDARAVTRINAMFKRTVRLMKESFPLFDAVGLNIYNCTPDSGLTVFPFVGLEDAIKDVAIKITENASGLYSRAKPDKKYTMIPRNGQQQNFMVVGHCTPLYRPNATAWEENLKQMGIEYDLFEVEDRGDWTRNTKYKPEIILQALDKYSDMNIVYLDVDARVYKFPELFNSITHDIGMHWLRKRGQKEFLSGTMFVQNNQTNRDLMNEWIAEAAADKKRPDQQVLQRIIERKENSIDVVGLPDAYCKIFDRQKSCTDPVIVHYQISRQLKKIRS